MMLRKTNVLLASLIVTIAAFPTHAYELATHGHLTYAAFKRSVLSPGPNEPSGPQILKTLGIENGANAFGRAYYDMSGSDVRERTSHPFEEDQRAGRMPPGTEPLSIEGWLMRGAIREDDHPLGENPKDDPAPDFRFRHHFCDPVRDRALAIQSA